MANFEKRDSNMDPSEKAGSFGGDQTPEWKNKLEEQAKNMFREEYGSGADAEPEKQEKEPSLSLEEEYKTIMEDAQKAIGEEREKIKNKLSFKKIEEIGIERIVNVRESFVNFVRDKTKIGSLIDPAVEKFVKSVRGENYEKAKWVDEVADKIEAVANKSGFLAAPDKLVALCLERLKERLPVKKEKEIKEKEAKKIEKAAEKVAETGQAAEKKAEKKFKLFSWIKEKFKPIGEKAKSIFERFKPKDKVAEKEPKEKKITKEEQKEAQIKKQKEAVNKIFEGREFEPPKPIDVPWAEKLTGEKPGFLKTAEEKFAEAAAAGRQKEAKNVQAENPKTEKIKKEPVREQIIIEMEGKTINLDRERFDRIETSAGLQEMYVNIIHSGKMPRNWMKDLGPLNQAIQDLRQKKEIWGTGENSYDYVEKEIKSATEKLPDSLKIFGRKALELLNKEREKEK